MKVQSTKAMSALEIPSKTFLCGEYSVLRGHRALIFTHAPFFRCELKEQSGEYFHPESPAGRLEVLLTGSQQRWSFEDPHAGLGGFGGSTAEYICVYKSLKPEGDVQDAVKMYFDLFKAHKTEPSGADLVSQYWATEAFTVFSKNPLKFEETFWPFDDVSILVYKTEYKVPTHKHLEKIDSSSYWKLGQISDECVQAFLDCDSNIFFKSLREFSLEQQNQKLLLQESFETTETLNALDGVIFSRGCGAMGADVLALFVKKRRLDYVEAEVEKMNLGLKRVL